MATFPTSVCVCGGGVIFFPRTASFLLHPVPPFKPGVKGKGAEENGRSAHSAS